MLLSLTTGTTTQAQDALRSSMAGQEMAEARRLAAANQKFNVKLGPVSLRFTANMAVEATDNVRAVQTNTQPDLILRPQLNVFSLWRVTEKNNLTLGLGLGYHKYLHATEYDSLFLTPDTDLSFDIYVGDVAINLHDRFDYTQDVTSDPTISGTGSLSRYENTVGIRTVWDLNKAFISATYDHRNLIATDPANEYLTHAAELFSSTVGFQLQPTLQAGVELSGGLLDYSQMVLPDNQHAALGLFGSAQISEYTLLRLAGGYVSYFMDATASTNSPGNRAAFYFEGSLRQRVSDLLTHTLTFGRSVQSGMTSQLVDLWRVNYSATWNLLLKTGLNTTLSYEHGVQPGAGGETLDRFGAGFTLSRLVTEHSTANLGYQFYYKDSDAAGRDYLQNRLVLSMAYTF